MLKTALLQIAPCDTLSGNLEKGVAYCKKAKGKGADVALFPEMWSNGYRIGGDGFNAESGAVSADSDFVRAFGKAAKEFEMAVGVTFLEERGGTFLNSFALFDRFGERKFVYSKVHTCDFGDEGKLARGEDFFVASLDTAAGEVKVGAMICYDREFPESARILMLKGAELILVPNACPLEINRLSQLRARAYENMSAVATCNYPDTESDCNGCSCVFDGVAYLSDFAESRDMCILQADGKEGVYVAELDLDRLRAYRNNEVHGNAYRRPETYGMLTDRKIKEPFIRADRRK